MNDAIVIRKLNEMFVVQTTLLNAYQNLGETSSDDEVIGKFANFAGTAKEILAAISGIVESLGGELIDNVEDISQDLKRWSENFSQAALFSDKEPLRYFFEAYILENLNHRNWSILKELAEEAEDQRLEPVKSAEDKVDKIYDWLKDKIEEISLEEMR